MSSRNKKASTTNDVKKKQTKLQENLVENVGRRRSLRNNAGASVAASPTVCKKSTPSSRSKQVEKIINNTVDESISKNGSPRSTRNSPQVNVSNSTQKKASVPIEKTPVRTSPRASTSNGSIDAMVRRNPRRKTNNFDAPVAAEVHVPETVQKDSTVKTKTRMSSRKRPLSPEKETILTDACNATGELSAKRRCRPTQSKKVAKSNQNTQENGDVQELTTDDPKLEGDVTLSTVGASHSTKASTKRPLDIDSDDEVTLANKKIKCDIPPIKLSDTAIAKKLVDTSSKTTQKSPNKKIDVTSKLAEISPAKQINKLPTISPEKPVKQINKLVEKSPVKPSEILFLKSVEESTKQTNELSHKSTDISSGKQKDILFPKLEENSPVKQILSPKSKAESVNQKNVSLKSTEKTPMKCKSYSMNSSDITVANSDKMETTPSAAVIVKVTSKEEENGIQDTILGHLFADCNLNVSQEKELLSHLPENYTGLTREELVETMVKLLLETETSIKSMTSPRFNKFLRNLLSIYCTSSCAVDKKHWLCENALNWAKERKTVNLTHELELALMHLYYNTKCYKKAEHTATVLYSETKKLQDKEKVVQACLCLSQIYHAMGNISKARANITTAKTEALKIYTAPDLQAELDLQSGIMQVAEEKDMETAYSYFKEAATGFTIKKKRSRALKYMLLSKLLINKPEEGEKIVMMQAHVLDVDEGVEALVSVTKAAISSSLEEFKNALDKYNSELTEDLVVKDVIDKLYTKMLEKNLINIIKPYDKIQISYVANRIGLPRDDVERRLSRLILDGQVKAQLDHRDDCLYVYESETADRVYPMALDTMSQLDRTLTHLNKRVKQLLL